MCPQESESHCPQLSSNYPSSSSPLSPHCLLEGASFHWLQGKRVKSGQGGAGALSHFWFPPLFSEPLLASLVPQGPSAATVTGVLGLEDILRPSTSMKNQGTSTGSAGGAWEGSTFTYEKRLFRPGNSPPSGSPVALQACDSTGHPSECWSFRKGKALSSLVV